MWVEKNKGLTTSVIRLCLSSGPGGTRIPNLLIRSHNKYNFSKFQQITYDMLQAYFQPIILINIFHRLSFDFK